jgi:alkylation response protein AidB-like acyl-CoA dehydrogenase
VDLAWNDDQRAILEAVDALCERYAGPARAIALDAKAEWDADLDAALTEAGFAEIALGGDDTGSLEAAMVVECVARSAGTLPIGAQLLVAPRLTGRVLPGPVALVSLAHPGPVRFGDCARTALVDAGDEARLVPLAPGSASPVRSNFMLPVGRIALDDRSGESLGPGSGEVLRRWWRVALAAEFVGTMQAALDVTVAYAKNRRQFGRAIGSFQALQHRLAMSVVRIEGARFLALEAAAREAPEEAAATAAAHAADAANHVFREMHQMTGAMGFTREHDLHVYSMRLQAMRLELGGTSAHLRAIAARRWNAPSRD